ncbi:MAG: oligosaccharide flippase family protein [Patescibacteria group bacterium]
MLRQLRGLLLTDTGRDTAIVFTGSLINLALGGLFFILAPRILGPENFGLFAVVTATGIMAINFANFALDTGILKFASANNDQSKKILSLAFKAYLIIGVAVFLIGLIIASPLAKILGQPQITNLLRISFFGVIFVLLTNFFIAALQSKKQFAKASIVNISGNTARILLLVLGAYFFTVNLYFLTFLYYLVVIISVVIGKFFVPLNFLSEKTPANLVKNFLGYNFWIAASMAISSIPIDEYLLVKISGPIQTGLFAAPMKIISAIDQLTGDFTRVLAPRFTSFDSNEKAKIFAKKTIPVVLVISIGIFLTILIASPLIKFLFGAQYLESINVYRILVISSALGFFTTIPVSIIIYYFGKTKDVFLMSAIGIFVWLIANLLLIPKYAALGAAWAYFISVVVGIVLFVGYVIVKFSKNNGKN